MKRYKQIWEVIADGIREDIVSGRYKPEDRLREAELANEYSVSKTPVREALRYLESIGFVEIIPNTMARVKKLQRKDMMNLSSIQSVLEGLAARESAKNLSPSYLKKLEKSVGALEECSERTLHHDAVAYEKANFDFHSIIWEMSKNDKLIELLRKTHAQIQLSRSIYRHDSIRYKDMVPDHRKILEAIRNKNGPKAEALIRRHIEKHGEIIVGLLENDKDS